MLTILSDRYHALRAELNRLQSAEVRDMRQIEQVLDQLSDEYRRLKAHDGQHGNNPIEWRHSEPPPVAVAQPKPAT